MIPKFPLISTVMAAGLALATAAATPAGEPSATALRVMSFNVRTSTGEDGVNVWPQRRELLFRQIEAFGPALIGFQEARADQHDEIVARMAGHEFVGVARDDGKRQGEWTLLGYRRDRFERLANGDFWLSETPEVPGSKSWDAAITRICTWARLRDRATGGVLLYANTHFDHIGVVSREHAARLIVRWLTDLAGGAPVVLTGDFNVSEDTAAYAIIARPQDGAPAWLLDSYRELHPQRSPDEATYHGFQGGRTGSRIDFIFHSRPLRPLAATIEAVDAVEGRYPSDHFAVTAVLDYVPPTAPARPTPR